MARLEFFMGKILVIISVCPMPSFFTMLALYLNYTKFESDISKASIITLGPCVPYSEVDLYTALCGWDCRQCPH